MPRFEGVEGFDYVSPETVQQLRDQLTATLAQITQIEADMAAMRKVIADLEAGEPVEPDDEPPVERPTFGPREVYKSGMVAGKAYIIVPNDAVGEATSITSVEGLNMEVDDHNGAVIRQDSDELTVRDLYAHDGECGILGSPGALFDIAWSRAENLGDNRGSGIAHPFYVATRKVRVSRIAVYRPRRQAHCFKARLCDDGLFEYSIFAMLDGHGSRCIDLTDGGSVTLRRCIFQVGPNWDQANTDVLGFAREVDSIAGDALTLEDVIFVNDHPTRRAVMASADGKGMIKLRGKVVFIGNFDQNNLLLTPGMVIDTSEADVIRYPTRADAGWPAYNGAEMCIPWRWGPRPGLWDEDQLSGVPVFDGFSAPASVPPNGSAAISWDVSGAHDVLIGDEAYSSKDQVTVGPISAPRAVTVTAIGRDAVTSRTVAIEIGAETALDLANLPQGWTEVPDTKFPGHFDAINAWGTAALTGGSLWILAQGGHKTVTPGHVWRFQLATMSWQKERDADPIVGRTSATQGKDYVVSADSGPPPKHGYNGVTGIGNRIVVGGAFPPFAFEFPGAAPNLPVVDGTKSGSPWLYDPDARTYESLSNLITSHQQAIVADEARGLVFVVDSNKSTLLAIDIAARKVVGTMRLPYVALGTIAYGDGKIVWFGTDTYHSDRTDKRPYLLLAVVDVFDPSEMSGTYRNLTPDVPPGSVGGTYKPVDQSLAPAREDWITAAYGLQYHPPSKRFAAWKGGTDLLWFDPATFKIARQSFATGPADAGDRNDGGNGVFGRFRYMSQYGAFIGLCSPKQNVWLLRP